MAIVHSQEKGAVMNNSTRRIKGLGEVSIRVQDLDVMEKFYIDVVGLEVLRKEQSFVFFKIAEGYGGHTQNLALFDAKERTFHVNKSIELNPESSTLHHIALNVDLDDFEIEKERLAGLGLDIQVVDHPWIHVHSLYFSDPEGNLLELVSYDAKL
jgi:catechol 2,3-dioxygenase-like lactoylglutathione lyase family enzyme